MRRAEHLESIFRLRQTCYELDNLNVGLHLPRDGGDDLLADGGEEAEESEIARGFCHLNVCGDGRRKLPSNSPRWRWMTPRRMAILSVGGFS